MNKCFNFNIKSLLRVPFIRRHFSETQGVNLAEIQHKADAESWTYAALLVIIPFSGLYAYKKLVLDQLPEITEIPRKSFSWGPEADYFRKYNPKPRDDDFGPPPKEPALTRLMRKAMQHNLDKGYKNEVEILEFGYQQMMEHIERKKFPDLPRYPEYSKYFGKPVYDIRHEHAKLPRSFDD